MEKEPGVLLYPGHMLSMAEVLKGHKVAVMKWSSPHFLLLLAGRGENMCVRFLEYMYMWAQAFCNTGVEVRGQFTGSYS